MYIETLKCTRCSYYSFALQSYDIGTSVRYMDNMPYRLVVRDITTVTHLFLTQVNTDERLTAPLSFF